MHPVTTKNIFVLMMMVAVVFLPQWKVTLDDVMCSHLQNVFFFYFQASTPKFWLTKILATNEGFSKTHCVCLYSHICAT
jgi:hypothetical protein